MSARAAVAVVVPAAGEAALIERLIATLHAQDYEGPVAVVIAVNGAGDRTALIARAAIARHENASRLQQRFRVIELAERSKTHALNAGEQEARSELTRMGRGEPDVVLYLDADIELSSNAIEAMVVALAPPHARIVQPHRCAQKRGGLLARLAGRALCALPWIQDDIACGGLFAVNRAGRARWESFPSIAADDAFVFNRFTTAERIVVHSAWATHPMPATLRGLARQQRRWREARRELACSCVSSAQPCDATPKWPYARRARAIVTQPRVLIALTFLRIIRLASVFDRTQFTSHAWSVDREANAAKDAVA